MHTLLSTPDIKTDLIRFIASPDFLRQIQQQDIDRGWYNMYLFRADEEAPVLKPGQLIKEDVELKIAKAAIEPVLYLAAMLTADSSIGNFRSYYSKEKSAHEARTLAEAFLAHLGNGLDAALYTIEPDFLVNGGEDTEADNNTICYFEGMRGSDSATLLVFGADAYLLLTNGIP